MLNSFWEERGDRNPKAPYAWSLNGKGRSVTSDPALGDGAPCRRGLVPSAALMILASLSGFTAIRLDTGEEKRIAFDHFGVRATGRVLPTFRRALVAGNVLNRRVGLSEYRDGRESVTIAWIE